MVEMLKNLLVAALLTGATASISAIADIDYRRQNSELSYSESSDDDGKEAKVREAERDSKLTSQ